MFSNARLVTALLVATAGACGPSVQESRMVFYPPRAANCNIEFVQVPFQDINSNSPWIVVGQVFIAGLGEQDPFTDRNRAIIVERACRMGGEAVTIAISATNSYGGTHAFGILRHREPATPPAPSTH